MGLKMYMTYEDVLYSVMGLGVCLWLGLFL